MKLLLIGSGTWGSNFIKTCNELNISLTVGNRDNWQELIESKEYQGVIIATPPNSHVDIAEYAFQHNLPCIIEKPLSLNLQDCERLYQYNIPVIIDYIHLFSDNYQLIKQKIDPNKINKIISTGGNLGPFRNYSTLWDYAPHDLAMILDLSQKYPNFIQINKEYTTTSPGQIYLIWLIFNNFESFSSVGNGFSKKNRELIISCNKYNDPNLGHINYQYLDTNQVPPLIRLLETFIKIINGAEDIRTGWELTKNINKILSIHQDTNIS